MRKIDVPGLRKRWDTNGVPYGTVEQVEEQLATLADVGVSKYYLQWLRLEDTDGLNRFVDVAKNLA
jgi:hypothetical protein